MLKPARFRSRHRPADRMAGCQHSRRAAACRSDRTTPLRSTAAPTLTALGLLLALSAGDGHAAEKAVAALGDPTRSGSAAASAVAGDDLEALLAGIEARAHDLRLQADAGAGLRGELDAAGRRIEELTAALEAARGAAEARLRELSEGLDAAAAERAELRAALQRAEERTAQLVAERDDAERRAAQLTHELNQALTEAGWLDKEMESAWRAVDEKTTALEDAQAARAAAEAELAELRRKTEVETANLTSRLAASTAEVQQLRDRLRTVQARLERVHASLVGEESANAVAAGAPSEDASPPADTGGGIASAATAQAAAETRGTGTAATVQAAPKADAVKTVAARQPEPLPPQRQSPPDLAALDARQTGRGLEMVVPGDKLFRFDSDEIHPEAGDILARIGRVLEFYRDRSVLIVGHTDSIGDAAYNQYLSERRARAVRDYFLDAFKVDERRLQVTGLGPSKPIASNATSLGRRQNRRVEVVILN